MPRVRNTRSHAAAAQKKSAPINVPPSRNTRRRAPPNTELEPTINKSHENLPINNEQRILTITTPSSEVPSTSSSVTSDISSSIVPSTLSNALVPSTTLSNALVQHNSPPVNNYSYQQFPTRSYFDLKTAITQIPDFCDDSDERCTLSNFITACKETYEVVSPVDQPLLLLIIKSKIKGRAKSLISNLGTPGSLDILFSWLKQAFGRSFDDERAQEELRKLRQKDGESVVAYGARAGEILSRALEAAKEKYRPAELVGVNVLLNQTAVNGFITGLSTPLFNVFVSKQNPDSLSSAINTAAAVERKYDSRNELLGTDNVNHRSNNASIHAINADNFRCYECGETGHLRNNCPVLLKRKQSHHYDRLKTGDRKHNRDTKHDRHHREQRSDRRKSDYNPIKNKSNSLNEKDAQRRNATRGTEIVARSRPTGSITALK